MAYGHARTASIRVCACTCRRMCVMSAYVSPRRVCVCVRVCLCLCCISEPARVLSTTGATSPDRQTDGRTDGCGADDDGDAVTSAMMTIMMMTMMMTFSVSRFRRYSKLTKRPYAIPRRQTDRQTDLDCTEARAVARLATCGGPSNSQPPAGGTAHHGGELSIKRQPHN